MSTTDDLLRNNVAFREDAGRAARPKAPAIAVAVVACMDARIDVYRVLGLKDGEAHVIRNAGGVVTDDAMRSLVISQRLLGTEEVILIHHTDCGMQKFTDDELAAKLEAEVGERPPFAFHAFRDLASDVRAGMDTVRTSPFLVHHAVRGFVYDVVSGALEEVDGDTAAG